MKYKVEDDLKHKMRVARIAVRDLAIKMNIPPTTLSSKLNGYSALIDGEREMIDEILSQEERN